MTTTAVERSARVHPSIEQSVLLLGLLAGLPASALVLYGIWAESYTFEVRWTITAVIVCVWLGAAAAARQMVTRVLFVAANLLGALREGDYSIRGVGTRPGSAADLVMAEINALGQTLQRQRTEAVESTALLSSVMQAIDVAMFAFDTEERLVLVNPAAERLLGRTSPKLLGRRAAELRLDPYLSGPVPRLVDRSFAGHGALEVRRSTFYRDGKPHQLVAFSDVSRALREQEQLAWQRIVRVLSHEINNSLTPIKSIAHTLKRMVSRVPDLPRGPEITDGLTLIETRSGALGRFLRAYAQLAKLPKPQPKRISILPLARRVAELEHERLAVEIRAAADIHFHADPDQLEQLLINIVRNAVDAALETGGGVWIDWAEDSGFELRVEDEGPGLPDTANLFVPFFTTKPTGSGIGLVLCRQIAEAHGGTLTLEARGTGRGCKATLRLPALQD
ncbi:MAG TPA: ATP-binding protein [Vicinamibacterales bacterium]|jgi:PAS domain S-box-containing protein|nr:ATP-binding protein [Vicinamibacterales bacterium]